MIITEKLTINEKSFTKTYSDAGFMIERDGVQYSEAIDPADIPRKYTETDKPVEGEDELTVADALEVLNEFGVDTDDKNEMNTHEGIKEWINPKESQKPYNKGDKCYYKEQFWVSTIDNNISEPGSLTNTWINI